MISTSLCTTCGIEIKWGRRIDGSTHPPLVMTGHAYVIFGGAVRDTTTYERHVCSEEDIASYEITRKTKAGQAAEQRLLLVQYVERKEIAWKQAEKRPCPKCGALSGEACENLTKRAKGIAAETSWPHPDRLPKTEPEKED